VLNGNVHVPYGNEPLALAAVAENRAQIVFGDRNAALSDRKVESTLSDVGFTAFASSTADFAKFIAEETAKWAKVVKFCGVKLD